MHWICVESSRCKQITIALLRRCVHCCPTKCRISPQNPKWRPPIFQSVTRRESEHSHYNQSVLIRLLKYLNIPTAASSDIPVSYSKIIRIFTLLPVSAYPTPKVSTHTPTTFTGSKEPSRIVGTYNN